MSGSVLSVSASDVRSFSKPQVPAIQLCRCTETVFLIDGELYMDLHHPVTMGGRAYICNYGDFGEHITTSALDITNLPVGTMLHFSPRPSLVPENNGTSDLHEACVILTGLVFAGPPFDRYAAGLNRFAAGLSDRINHSGRRPVGMVGVVLQDGFVMMGQRIRVQEPDPETSRRLGLTALENTNRGGTKVRTSGVSVK